MASHCAAIEGLRMKPAFSSERTTRTLEAHAELGAGRCDNNLSAQSERDEDTDLLRCHFSFSLTINGTRVGSWSLGHLRDYAAPNPK
jgi:hypothetical protein